MGAGITRDFTDETKELLLRQIEDKEENWKEQKPLITGALNAEIFFALMEPFQKWDNYRERIEFKNKLTIQQINDIWENVETIDRSMSHKFQMLQELSALYIEQIQMIINILEPNSEGNYDKLAVTATKFEQNFKTIEDKIEEQKIQYEMKKLINQEAFDEQLLKLQTGNDKTGMQVSPCMLLAMARYFFIKKGENANNDAVSAILEELEKRLKSGGLPKGIQEQYEKEAGNIRVETFITKDALEEMGWSDNTLAQIETLKQVMKAYDINTTERMRHFLAQCGHETKGKEGYGSAVTESPGKNKTAIEGDNYFEEKYGVGTPAGKNIGNTEAGDGSLFRGSGGIHLTGRWNYQQFSNYIEKKTGVTDGDIMDKGYQCVSKNYVWEAAGWYWQTKHINDVIEEGKPLIEVQDKVHKKINPGEAKEKPLSEDDEEKASSPRRNAYEEASKVIPSN